jgi:hypothetical protein
MLYRRQILLGAAFLLTLAASVFNLPWQNTVGADAESIVSEPAPKLLQPNASASARARAEVPVRLRGSGANPFVAHDWTPPPVVQAVRAEVPRAPPLPFVYLGKMLDGKEVTAFVSQGGKTHLLRGGDTLRDYRVDTITTSEITFVYLPLHEKQRLPIGIEN